MNTPTPTPNKNIATQRRVAIVLVVIALALWGSILIFADKKPEVVNHTAKKSIGIGDTGIIRAGVPGATNTEAYSELMTFVSAKDQEGLNQLIQAGKAIYIDNDTQVKVIEIGLLKKRVRLLSGDHKGAAVWLPSELVESE